MRKMKGLLLVLDVVFTLSLCFKVNSTMLLNCYKFCCKGCVSKPSGQHLVYSNIMTYHLVRCWENIGNRNPRNTLRSHCLIGITKGSISSGINQTPPLPKNKAFFFLLNWVLKSEDQIIYVARQTCLSGFCRCCSATMTMAIEDYRDMRK